MYLVISTSLSPESNSRILARAAVAALEQQATDVKYLDLAELNLPLCDASSCYGHADSIAVTDAVSAANGILIASPIYNYDLSSAAKNLIEITGKAWTDKIVGFLCAAGGQGSFMAPMGLANSLMLDFRSIILPRFVYATGDAFTGQQLADVDCEKRVEDLVGQLVRVAQALQETPKTQP